MAKPDPFERVDVSDWPVGQIEASGSTTAQWLMEPGTGFDWLHKSITLHAWGEQGEDWAEVLSTRVAILLGVPCAETRLCVRDGVRGSLSRSLNVRGFDFNEGGVTLAAADAPGYFRNIDGIEARDPARPGVQRPGHNLTNIHAVLAECAAPDGFAGPSTCSGYDVFAGMLLLDALVANRDRHEQNWAVLRAQLLNQTDRLAPSFDHGGSLGYNLTDKKRQDCLSSPSGVEKWAARGTAWRFEHKKPCHRTLVELAADGLRRASKDAQSWWREKLEALNVADVGNYSTLIPEMSDPASKFSTRLLEVNKERLRDELDRA